MHSHDRATEELTEAAILFDLVVGGTAGNLSALIAARSEWRHQADGAHDRTRGLMVASAGAHSSIVQAAHLMDADVVAVPADDDVDEDGA